MWSEYFFTRAAQAVAIGKVLGILAQVHDSLCLRVPLRRLDGELAIATGRSARLPRDSVPALQVVTATWSATMKDR